MATSNYEEVIVLTGANEGIGYHMMETMVEETYRVAALDINGGNVSDLQNSDRDHVRYYECDVGDTDAVDTAVEAIIDDWGGIDILVNNAGIARYSPFFDQSMDDTRREFEVNFFGYLRMIRAVLPHMLERGTGIIHNMGSGTADVGHPGLSGYAATKGAIKALVRSLQLELRDTGVSSTLMIPPTTNTGMVADLNYPAWMSVEPDEVGRKLAGKIHSTRPVITPDWNTSIGLWLIRRFPSLWRRMTARYARAPAHSHGYLGD